MNADFIFVDFLLPWQASPGPRYRRYLSWLLCAVFLPNKSRYRIFLTEAQQFPPLLMRRLKLISARQIIVGLIDDHTPYFLKSGRYKGRARSGILWALSQYDVLICIGQMQTEIVRELIGSHPNGPIIVTAPSAVSDERRSSLSLVKPSLDSLQIVFVGNGLADDRGWYKGLDILLAAFALVEKNRPAMRLDVVGEWDSGYLDGLLNRLPEKPKNVQFVGTRSDLSESLSRAALYIHLARGEAWGISIIEAMTAGLPALVSEWTGAKEAAREIDERFVVPLDAEKAAERILWYFDLTHLEKQEFSDRARQVASEYTADRATRVFRQIFNDIVRP